MLQTTTKRNIGLYRSPATEKKETVADSLSFSNYIPQTLKNVQVACLNKVYNGVGFRNDNGGFEFFSQASKHHLAEIAEKEIVTLYTQLFDIKKELYAQQKMFNEGSNHISDWITELHEQEDELARLKCEQKKIIEQGKAGTIDKKERERQRYLLRISINKTMSNLAKIKDNIDSYRLCEKKIMQLESLVEEMEIDISDKEKQKSNVSTFTVQKNGIITFPMVLKKKQNNVCVFANIMDYISYIVMVYEVGYSNFPKQCDCIVMNSPANFMQMLIHVDTYDHIFCFMPDTFLYKSLEKTIIQRELPRAESMEKYYTGYSSLYDFVMSLDENLIKNFK